MKIVLLLSLVILLIGCVNLDRPSVKQEIIDTQQETIIENLDTPWSIDFLPDGRMIFTERGGKVSLFDGKVQIIANIDVSEISESGLSGIAVDPEFEKNSFVYIYYTHKTANRVSRFGKL